MRAGRLLLGALAMTAFASPASATGPETRTVVVVLSPPNAAISVNGHPRQHPDGSVVLSGPLGSVFTIEAEAKGSAIVERVAVTEVGALPSRVVVPEVRSVAPASGARSSDECVQPFWRDVQNVRHYKPQCAALEQYGDSDSRKSLGGLSVVCTPKCTRIVDNGDELGAGHIFSHPVAPGRHRLDVVAPNGVMRSLVVDVGAGETKAVRISMDPSFMADLLSEPTEPEPQERSTALGYLTVTSSPWSNVSEGGRPLCLTPCAKIPMASGVHSLVLEDETGDERFITVRIKGGETTVRTVSFD
jgi:hypothetical protein